ncbi:MAG: tetratricopeptide repeat protein [Bacteroidales bacterium]|nr:tetratricopeptide repeat protein [Bacteroidales bacterium]
MRPIRKILIALLIINGISSALTAGLSASEVFQQNKKSRPAGNKADVERYSSSALSYGSKIIYLEVQKAYIDTAELICKKENIEIPAILHLARAEYFFNTGDYNNSSQEASIAVKLAKSFDETDVLAKALNFLGRYYLRTGSFKESIEYFEKSIELLKKIKLKGFTTRSYSGIADVYKTLGNQIEYRNSLQKMIDAGSEEMDTLFIEDGLYKLGTDFLSNERDFEKGDSLLKKCNEIALIRGDTAFISLSYANMGWNFYLEKKYNEAIKTYEKSLKYSIPFKRFADVANALGNLGTIYRDMSKYDQALKYYNKSIDYAQKVEDVYNLSWVYDDMSQLYIKLQDTSNAYKSYVLFKKYSDAQIKKSNVLGLSDARIRYEAETHKKELQLLSLRIRNQRLMLYGFTGLFVLCIAIGILIISRAKINAKRRISEMNHKISEITQANLRQQMNPHFIFNTLNSIQYYMYQHDKLATNNYLTKFSSLMRKVLENSQHTAVPLRDELDALNLYLELEKIRFKDKFDYNIDIDEEIDTILYKVPTMLIQPYVENSICHGLMPLEGKGQIKIDLKLKKDYISCIIEDNGIGREAANEKKTKCEKNHNSLGTQIVNSRLDLVNTLYGTSLKTIYTDLKNKDGEPEGTRVEIHIPILT